jgi:DNA-binding SARP family transcriptional activator/predicted ATPase
MKTKTREPVAGVVAHVRRGLRPDEGRTPEPGEASTGPIVITLLGEFGVSVAGVVVDPSRWKLKHPRLLWQMLCLAPGHRVSRDEAAEALWPQATVQASSNRLHHTLHALRGILGEAGVADVHRLVSLQAGTLQLNAGASLDVDVQRFAQAVAAARACNGGDAAAAHLEEAHRIHRGELALPAGAGEWFTPYREALLRARVGVLETLAQRYRAAGRIDDAVQTLQCLVRAEPSAERAHRYLIELYAAQQRPDLAVQQYAVCRRCLQRRLGTEPSAATQQLVQRIAADPPCETPIAAAGIPPQRAPYVAPLHASPLLGREADLAELQRWLLSGGARLITITAAGGMGKTRLAAALAERVQQHFRDGVHFVALGTLAQPLQLAERICQSLQLKTAGQPAERVLPAAVACRRMLLVLDGFEQLIDAAPQLSRWLKAAPQLHIVVTSQSALKSRVERVYRLPTLLATAPPAAVELFELTARRVGVTLQMPADEAVIRRVCERLGGNALAIELAAAQLVRVGLGDLPDALARAPLMVLAGVAPNGEPRHTSLEVAIAWSCSLLTADEATVLKMASVFIGDFSADDAQAALSDLFDAAATQALLRALTGRHLLVLRTDPAPCSTRRFAMLDAVRAFAHRGASADPRWPRVRQLHAEHFRQAAERAYAAHHKGLFYEAGPIYRTAAAEIGQSLQWLREHAAAEDYLRSCWHVAALQFGEGAVREAIQSLAHAVRVPARTRGEMDASAWCHYALARLHDVESNFRASMHAAKAARLLARGSASDALIDRIGYHLATLSLSQLQIDKALRFVTRSIARLELPRHRDLLATHHLLRAACLELRGQHARSHAAAEMALDGAYQARQAQYTVVILQVMAKIDRLGGRLGLAEASLHECAALIATGCCGIVHNGQLVEQGALAFERGRLAEAQALFERARANAQSLQLSRVILCDLWLAFVSMEMGREFDVMLLLSVSDRSFPLKADQANEYVLIRTYRLRLQSERGQWPAVQATLTRLQQLQRRCGNPLWASWIAESAALLAHHLGRAEQAQALLVLSRRLQSGSGIQATPRQLASWARLQARLRQAPPCLAARAPQAVAAALDRLLPDLRRCGEVPTVPAVHAETAPAPVRSALAA